jgi:thymidylate kinase
MKNGYLISFEGDDGSGKTTAISKTMELLREKHRLDVVLFSANRKPRMELGEGLATCGDECGYHLVTKFLGDILYP